MPRIYDYDAETGAGDWLFPNREIAHRGRVGVGEGQKEVG